VRAKSKSVFLDADMVLLKDCDEVQGERGGIAL
jgi:hypothetical protein